ncbi:hypothetical protein [Streptomyces sp. NPDC047981]|uniref:hypothetical protein n=1 Tax=Streptomyces sp. NPDC047981 TaxID=3154610 RepID=UPI0034292D70
MNGWLLAAGVTAFGVAAVHMVAGRRDIVLPLLSCGLADEPRRVLHAVWHMVTVDLVLSAAALVYLATADDTSVTGPMAWFVAAHFLAYAVVFLVVTLSADWARPLLRLPQWMLLLPVAVLTVAGVA